MADGYDRQLLNGVAQDVLGLRFQDHGSFPSVLPSPTGRLPAEIPYRYLDIETMSPTETVTSGDIVAIDLSALEARVLAHAFDEFTMTSNGKIPVETLRIEEILEMCRQYWEAFPQFPNPFDNLFHYTRMYNS